MSLAELKQAVEDFGRDFFSHKILFHKNIDYTLITSRIFNNTKTSELITILKGMPHIKNKLDFCIEIIRWIAIKRFTFTNDYFKDLKIAFKLSLLYFFDFKTITPVKIIKEVYQVELERGNHVYLCFDSRHAESPVIILLLILLAQKLSEIIDASPFYLKNKRAKLREYVDKRFPNLSTTYKYILVDFLEYFEEKITIQIKDYNDEEMASKFFLESLIENYDLVMELLEIIEKDFWIKNIIKKYIKTIKNSILENYEKNCKIAIVTREKYKRILVAKEAEDSDIGEIIILPNELKKALLIKGQLGVEKNEEIKLYVILEEVEKNKNTYNVILPLQLKDKGNTTELYLFICEKCNKVDYTSYCKECKREKRIAYLCRECGITNLTDKCISCGKQITLIATVNTNHLELFKGLKDDMKISYKNIKYLEPNVKQELRIKHNIEISEKGVAEIELKAVPSTEFVVDDTIIELKEDEIILPSEIIPSIEKILTYTKEMTEMLYNLKELKTINLRIDEGSYLFVSSDNGIIHYNVKVKKILNSKFAIIHPVLYELLFDDYLVGNTIKIAIPLDFLLNASALYFDEEETCYIITEINHSKEKQIPKLKTEIVLNKNEETGRFSAAILNFRLKYKLLKILSEEIKNKIEPLIKCPKCGAVIDRPPIFLRCFKCGNKLSYKWSKKELTNIIKDLNRILEDQEMFKKYRRTNRKIKWFVSDYLKEEEKFERLDKFFSQ